MSAEQVRELQERNAKKRKKGGKHEWLKVKPGTIYLRVGPPWVKDGEVWKDVLSHGRYPDAVYCAKNDRDEKTGKIRRCSACKRQDSLKSDRSEFGKALFKLIHQNSHGLWNALVGKKVSAEAGKMKILKYEEGGFHILKLAPKWHNELLDVFADDEYREKSVLGVTHRLSGRVVSLRRIGESMDDTKYTFKAAKNETPISSSKERRIALVKTLVNLDELAYGSTDEELEAFLEKMERRAKKMALEAKHKKKEDEDEEDEESEEESESEDDEEEEESEDEDESEDGEDEEDSSKEDAEDDDEESEAIYKEMKSSIKKTKKKKKSSKPAEEDESEDEEDDE